MNRMIRLILTIVLAAVLAIGLLGLLLSQLLQTTFFSLDFYKRSIVSSTYIAKVHAAIGEDLEGQSAYVGVPAEVLTAGVDDTYLYLLIVDHLKNINDVLKMRADYQPVQYPASFFYQSLESYIYTYAADHQMSVSDEQLAQLQDVADDSAALAASHINLFDLNLLAGTNLFDRALMILNRLAGWSKISILMIIFSLAGLFAVGWRRWRSSLFSMFTTLWLTAVLVLIPSLMLQWFGLPRRLSLGTGYLKQAADTWLTNANNYLLIIGAAGFTISTSYLLAHFFISEKHRRHSKKQFLSQNGMI